jgi:hypothetical protein
MAKPKGNKIGDLGSGPWTGQVPAPRPHKWTPRTAMERRKAAPQYSLT